MSRLSVPMILVMSLLLLHCGGGMEEAPEMEAPMAWPEIAGYELMAVPEDNPMTEAKVALGKQLYYDQRLSGDGNRSCYGCHLQEHGLTDGRAMALGAFDKQLTRAAPTMWNVGYYDTLYWDGRSTALEKQVLGAWGGGNMGASGADGVPSPDDISASLNEIPGYAEQFQAVFGGPATPDHVAYAIAAFMRTIVTTTENSRFIAFQNGDETALNDQEKSGWMIFSKRRSARTATTDGCSLTSSSTMSGSGWMPRALTSVVPRYPRTRRHGSLQDPQPLRHFQVRSVLPRWQRRNA